MKCPSCGRDIFENETFCSECGFAFPCAHLFVGAESFNDWKKHLNSRESIPVLPVASTPVHEDIPEISNDAHSEHVVEADKQSRKSGVKPRIIIFVSVIVSTLVIVLLGLVIIWNPSKNADKTVSVRHTEDKSDDTVSSTQEAPTTTEDPSAPIGCFVFSEDTGYRTWWDLFNNVYNIKIENNNDPRIAKIIEYNNLDPATYSPKNGEKIYLPPEDVLNGKIEITWEPDNE